MTEHSTENPPLETTDRQAQKLRLIMSWIVIIILTSFGVFALMGLTSVHKTEGDYWQTLIREQFPVLVALPMAGLGSLFVTLILRISTGEMEFEIAGLKFKGGAAPIVFWVLCFLSVVVSIKLLWQN
ncbi:MAG: hypothetical protein AAGE93_15405 [Bacteroidota bacterium]